MITNDGVLPSFNQQIVVESKEHFIVDEEVITDENDYNQLNYMVDMAKEILPEAEKIVADAGYYNGQEMIALEGKIDYYMALNESTKDHAKGFIYGREKNLYICPEKKELIQYTHEYWHGRKYLVNGKVACS